MKLRVNRVLSGGLYTVDFSVGDFSADEVTRMKSFGIPVINMMTGSPNGRQPLRTQITRITPQFAMSFATEDEAKKYETEVVSQIREAMKAIRQRTDDFSSAQEVEI